MKAFKKLLDKINDMAIRTKIHRVYHNILVMVHLSPLSLAEKCRLAFGAAIVFVLLIALLLPYVWMSQLTKQAALNAGNARAEAFQKAHFQINKSPESSRPMLDATGVPLDPNQPDVKWFKFRENPRELEGFDRLHRHKIRRLLEYEDRDQDIILFEQNDNKYSSYIRIFRATENCLSCHNQQGLASSAAYSKNQPIGVFNIKRSASDIDNAMLMNKILSGFAFFIAVIGAFVAFYVITQRVILRPIRQLRALANNVAEGNLDIRSSINTHDEYEKLSDAFNHMLDGIQLAQQKLREANKQLDQKIAELSSRNIELYRANKLKGEFLANISHEFRTPLNSILGFAEILRDKPKLLKTDKGRRYAQNIILGGKSLLNLINDLLDLAKTEAGKMKLHIEATNIYMLCEEVVASFSEMTRQKKLKVKLDVEKNIPPVTTDPGKVRQILYNFFSNAVKFTEPKGQIHIKACMIDDNKVRISVIDTGCGIPESEKQNIFEKFRQVDGSITRPSYGSGLGLAISKELATLLAAEIGLESVVNEGSTFWIDLPVSISLDSQTENQTS